MTNNLTMQELLEQQEQEFNQVKAGQTITGKISKITNDEVVVELNYGFDGVIKNEELNLPKGKYASDAQNGGTNSSVKMTWHSFYFLSLPVFTWSSKLQEHGCSRRPNICGWRPPPASPPSLGCLAP